LRLRLSVNWAVEPVLLVITTVTVTEVLTAVVKVTGSGLARADVPGLPFGNVHR
jgi:hypothetical protein